MACTHAAACPLFPLLNASLDGWRRCYCDSADGWRGCARYQQSLRGQYVPLSLLPNGHDASLSPGVAEARGSGGGRAGGSPGSHAPGGAPTLIDLLFEHAPSVDTLPQGEGSRAALPDPPAPPPRSAREPSTMRAWWNRLVEWMRTPE